MKTSVKTYSVTLAAIAIATVLRWLLEPVLRDGAPFSTFTIAVIFMTWHSGWRAAILATVVGFSIALVLFILPRTPIFDDIVPALARFTMYFIVCFSIAGFGEAMRTAQTRSLQAEQLARQQAEMLRITFESIADGVIMTDVSGNITDMNPIAQDLTSWTRHDALGKPLKGVFNAVRECTRQSSANPLEPRPMKGRTAEFSTDTILISREGIRRTISDSISMIRDNTGRIEGKVVVFRDISAKRQFETEREKAQQQVIETLENITDGFLRFDREWRFTYINAEAERLMRRTRAELLGKVVWAEELPAIGARLEEQYRRAVIEQLTIEFEDYHQSSHRWFAVKGNPTSEGGLAVFFHDITDSKHSAEALRRSEERLRLAVDATGLGIFDYLPQTGQQMWSERCKAIWGLSSADTLPPKSLLEAVHPDDRALVRRGTIESLNPEGTGDFAIEHRVIKPDGTVAWVLVQGTTVFDEIDGRLQPTRSLGTMLDTTARKTAEESLRNSESRLALELAEMTRLQELVARLLVCPDMQTALDEVLDATITLLAADMGHIQLVNSHTGALEIVAQRGFHDDFLSYFRHVTVGDNSASGRALSTGRRVIFNDVEAEPTYVTHRKIAASAGYRAIQCTPLLGRDGTLLGMLSTHYRQPHRPSDRELRFLDLYARQAADLIERTRNEMALRESEARYRAIGEAIDFGVWMCNAEGRNIYASDSFLKLIGINQAQYSRGEWMELLHPDELEIVRGAWSECVRTCGTWDREQRVKGVDGAWHNILARGVPVRNEAHEVIGWVGINLDISRLKQAEESLRQNDRRKDEFLATLAHELRNPLAPMRNAIQLLRMEDLSPNAQESARDVIDRQIQQMTRLIDDLLDVSRITRNRLELRKERVELKKVIESALESSQPLIDKFGHQLTVVLPETPIILEADLTRLAQVCLNLLNNAAKYTERGGHLELRAQRHGDEIEISVKDNGIGIPEDKLPKLFQMFSQVENSISRSEGGLGIGLALVKRLVEMHGGVINAQSKGVGEGSTFNVRLPVVDQMLPNVETNGDHRRKTIKTNLRVLVVDDNLDAANTMTMILKMMGNLTQTVHDGEAAVTAAEEFQPDVILLDIGLPKMNGYEACRCIRTQEWGKTALIIAVTGWGQESDKRQAMEAGFDKHLVKPVNPQLLMQILTGIQESKDEGRSVMLASLEKTS